MRARIQAAFPLLVIASGFFFLSVPQQTYAAVPEPFIYAVSFIGMPMIPNIRYGIYQTALKSGDAATLQALVHSNHNPPPELIANLSLLGFSSTSTTTGNWAGYGAQYYPAYYYNFGPLTIGADIPDGTKEIQLTATDAMGSIAATTTRITIDNAPPAISLSSITFSTTSPRAGDYMYLSGTANGTGSALTVYEIRETLWDAQGNPIWPPLNGINYNQNLLTAAIASSTDGSFTRVPFVLIDSPEEDLAIADSLKISINSYDEAGNFATTSLMVPIPKSVPPDPCATPGACASNVLFLPGIEASRLYRPDGGGEKKLWEPGLNDSLHDLYLTPDGRSARADVYTKTGDVIDETPVTGANIYKSFIAKMNDLRDGQHLINGWEADPYDWRLSLDDILARGKQTGAHISYLDATNTPYIIQELKHLAATSKTGKVTIIAHSNGGLVAKKLTELLGTDASALIDKMIFIAVPQAGTPAAIAADMHGYGQSFGGGLYVSQATARTFASTSPMAYNLLPSARYFTQVDNPVISFDASLPDWISRYGAIIHSAETLRAFLTDSYGRVDAQTGDIDQPIQSNSTLLTNAEMMHNGLDNWTPPAGVELIQIAGWGVPTTVSGLTYKKKSAGVKPDPSFTIDGDGTVVVPSALWTSVTAGAVDYWVDLRRYNKDNGFSSGFGLFPFDHSRILEAKQVIDFVADQVTNATKSLSDYTYLSTEAPSSNDVRLRYALHSPLTLNLYDDQGRHTGVSTSTGQVEEQVPGTYYTEFGDTKYLFSDASGSAHIIMNGYAAGTFTFNIDQFSGDNLTASTTFKDISTTASTTAALSVQSDISTLSPMAIDTNGDGIADTTLTPILGGTVTLDTTPPELRIAFNTSTKSIAFISTDDVSTTTVTASTAYPVLKKGQKSGIATTTLIARDASGNITNLVYTKPYPPATQSDTATLRTIAYNDAVTALASTTLSYKWGINKNGTYQNFTSSLSTSLESLTSSYNSKKNTTTIMPANQTLPGMVIPYMMTKKGSMIISY